MKECRSARNATCTLDDRAAAEATARCATRGLYEAVRRWAQGLPAKEEVKCPMLTSTKPVHNDRLVKIHQACAR
jgi:hypothetical protein